LFYFASHIRRASKSGEKRFGRKKIGLVKKEGNHRLQTITSGCHPSEANQGCQIFMQKYQLRYSLVRLGKENVGIFHGNLEYFTAIFYI
jgi:hypothetical protein